MSLSSTIFRCKVDRYADGRETFQLQRKHYGTLVSVWEDTGNPCNTFKECQAWAEHLKAKGSPKVGTEYIEL